MILQEGPAIQGRLLDDQGVPLSDWIVEASSREAPSAQPGHDRTDAEGRFRIGGCADASYTVAARRRGDPWPGPARAVFEGARPGGPEVELIGETRPDARVRCTFVGPAGEPVGEVRLWVSPRPYSRYVTTDAEIATGIAEIGDLPAGRYVLSAVAPLYPNLQLGEHELRPGETLDLGMIRFAEPARITLEVTGPGDRVPAGLEVELRDGRGYQTTVPMALEAAGFARSGPASPGAYLVRVRAPGCVPVERRVELAEAQQLELEVALERAP